MVHVFISAGATGMAAPHAATVQSFESVEGLATLLAESAGPAVLVSDGIAEGPVDAVVAAIRNRTGQVIEVHSQRWDGFSHSAISAACRGVISGFGEAGIAAAIALFETEQAG